MSETLKHFEIERHVAEKYGFEGWVEVGAIDLGGEYPSGRDALTTWMGEQSQEPPLGRYRVIEPHGYLTEFDVSETRERVIAAPGGDER